MMLLEIALIVLCLNIVHCNGLSCHKLTSGRANHYDITLNSSLVYTLTFTDNEKFCIVRNANLTIKSTHGTIINCGTNQTQPSSTKGIVFINSTVTIARITFVSCGANLNALPHNVTQMFNATSPYYPTDFGAALLFIDSKVSFREVVMNSSYGFAVIGINIRNSSFEHCSIMSGVGFVIGTQQGINIGSGVLMHYFNDNDSAPRSLLIENSYFHENFMYIENCENHTYNTKENLNHISNSAALTLLYAQKNFKVHVTISKTIFSRNAGTYASSILILHNETHQDSVTKLTGCIMRQRFTFYNRKCPETAEIVLIIFKPQIHPNISKPYTALMLHNTSVRDPSERALVKTALQNRAVYIIIKGNTKNSSQTRIKVTNVTFERNYGNSTGVCMYICSDGSHSKDVLELESITVSNNNVTTLSPIASSSAILYLNRVTCIINGTKNEPSMFNGNYGTVFDATDSVIYQYGHAQFKDNKAINGPAISIHGNSRLVFMRDSVVVFHSNKAYNLGGAIYCHVSLLSPLCAIGFENFTTSCATNITFANNSAYNGGQSIYATPIYKCKLNNDSEILRPEKSTIAKYSSLFHFSGQNYSTKMLNISTEPISLISNVTEVFVYPGEEFRICISAKDSSGRNVYTVVNNDLAPTSDDFIANHNTWLLKKSEVQCIKEKPNCTDIMLSICSAQDQATRRTVFSHLPNKHNQVYNSVVVNIRRCPLGFQLENGVCVCSKAIKKFDQANVLSIRCSIQNQIFTRISSLYHTPWAGLVNSSFGIAYNCPAGHCVIVSLTWTFISSKTNVSLVRGSVYLPICDETRKGVLCGKCVDGLSLVFGSHACHSCPNSIKYWALIVFVLISGPFVVLVLYSLRLTLAMGTINGIIFYANVVNVNLVNSLIKRRTNIKVLLLFMKIFAHFLALLNFQSSIPTCFYDKMNEIQKNGLQLFYPYYLLFIVIIIIILSRHSTWLSNKTSHSTLQVLVTIFHASFSTLLLSTVQVFSSVMIYTDKSEYRAWLYDGSIKFLKDSQHIALAVIISIAVVPLILAYIIFLIATKYLLKRSSRVNLRVRQIYEAIHAPYKEGQEYWFVTRLLVFVLTCMISPILSLVHVSRYQSVYLVTASVTFLVLFGHILFRPYKKKALNMLDTWILVNLAVVYGAALIYEKNAYHAADILTLSLLFMMITFIGILIYHVLLVTQIHVKLKKIFKRKKASTSMMSEAVNGFNSDRDRKIESSSIDSYYGSCDQFREPILGD